MARMNKFTLLRAVISAFYYPTKVALSVLGLELEMLSAHQNAHQRGTISLLPAYYLPTICLHPFIFAPINPYCINTYKVEKRAENPCVGGSSPPLPIR